jgi:crotonobetainyl-CoA:carnitine CoA-transferase CaiB-like acyl-CoA transferase
LRSYNRGKAGVVLDLKSAAGLAAFRGLLAETDVFVTNVRRKSLESLGIDYEQLKEDFPALIFAHVTGWGRSETSNTGQVDAENEAAFDIGSFYARSGMAMALRQSPDSPLSQWPGGIGDLVTSLATAQGITAALFQRERGGGGQGQLVETSLLHTGIFTMGLPLVLAMLGQNSSDTIGWIPCVFPALALQIPLGDAQPAPPPLYA